MNSNNTKISNQEEFEQVARETLKDLQDNAPSINKAIDNIFAMRSWFLEQSIKYAGLDEKLFNHRRGIIENLDRLIDVVYTKQSLSKFIDSP